MANISNDLFQSLNTVVGKNYPTQDDFIRELPNISSRSLVIFWEKISTKADEVNPEFVKRIVTHFNAMALEGNLTLELARRVSAAIKTSFPNIKDEIELCCQTGAANDVPVFANKTLLLSSSPIIRRIFNFGFKEKTENKITLPPEIQKDNRGYLMEFLETEKIDQLLKNQLSPEHLQDLFELANVYQISELVDYLAAFINIDEGSYDYLLKSALYAKNTNLLKKCIKFKMERGPFKVKIKDLDDFEVKVYLAADTEKKLAEMTQFFTKAQQDKILPPVKNFELIIRKLSVKEYWDRKYIYHNLTLPQSLKDIVTSIDFFRCPMSFFEEMVLLAQGCRNLQSITLPTIHPLQIHPLQFIFMKILTLARTQTSPNLKSFKLFFESETEMTDDVGEKLEDCLQLAQLITEVHLNRSKITNGQLTLLTKLCSNLEELDLTGCIEIDDEGLKAIGENCPKLRRLNLSFCGKITGAGLQFLGQGCSDLNILNLSNTTDQIRDEDLEKLFQGCKKLKKFHFIPSYSKITDKGLIALIENCPDLRVLQMSAGLTSKGFMALVNGGSKLEFLSFSELYGNITDEELELLLQGCPNLRDLDLSYFKKITNRSLKVLAKECRHMERLNLRGCKEISDEGLTALADGCKKLVGVNLKWVCGISLNGLKYLMEKHPKIHVET